MIRSMTQHQLRKSMIAEEGIKLTKSLTKFDVQRDQFNAQESFPRLSSLLKPIDHFPELAPEYDDQPEYNDHPDFGDRFSPQVEPIDIPRGGSIRTPIPFCEP